jgi:chemosensory pili system protein ChpA (sensor histidine kinase/response regulator)
MGDKRNYAALDWVIGEIGETLKDARQSLEAYVEDPRDTARIRFCLTHIHQVHGSLQMVEFHGASLFAEEMEALAEALMHGQVTNEKEAQEALMRSLLQLPLYLDQVKTYHDDHPGVVLPLLNDLRAVRKQSYLSETNLFNPDLSSLSQVRGERHPVLQDKAKLKEVFKKLREMYQYATASVLRGVKIDEHLGYLDKVLVRAEGISRGTSSHPLWLAASALLEALVRDDVELSIAVRGLLRQLARELRILEEHGIAALDAPPREGLLRNLLYYVARAEDGGTRVSDIKEIFGLNNALFGGSSSNAQMRRGLISPPEPDAIRAVVVALQDELNTCKHLLDLALSGQGGMSDLEEMLPIVKRIGDTLAVLGIGEMRKQAMVQYEALTAIRDKGAFADGELIEVANGLANLENRLEAIAKGAGKTTDYASLNERDVEIDSAKHAVLVECRTGLETVKETIVEAMSNQWNTSNLPRAVDTLHHVRGGLLMVPLPRPAAIAEACSVYIRDQLSHRAALPGKELQTLADAIASIDYFLERLVGGHGDDLDMYLARADEALAQLDRYRDATAETDIGAEAEAEPVTPASANAVVDAADDQVPVLAETVSADAPTSVTPTTLTPTTLPPASADGEDEDEDNPIDDEIIEIFVEEAADVLATLDEYVPRWAANMADEDAIITIRRAFHTLKGSGRMVDAQDIGELAWSIENMLNRVLDRTVTAQPAQVQLIEQVLKVVPTLVDAFKNGRPHPEPTRCAQFIQWAQDLAQGRVPTALDSIGSYEDVPPPVTQEVEPEVSAEVVEENEDQVLWEIFASEALTHLAVVDDYIAEMMTAAPLYSPPTDQLQRALHTLKGSAHMASVAPIAAIMTPLETFIKELRSYQLRIDDDILQLLQDAAHYTREGLDCIYAHKPVVLPKQEQFIARVQELSELHLAPLIHLREIASEGEHKAVDPRLLAIFMAEEMSLLLDADLLLARWREAPESLKEELPPLIAELQTLSEGARQANLPVMSGFADQLKAIHSAALGGQLAADDGFFTVLIAAHEKLLDMVDQIAAGQNIVPVSAELQAELDALSAETAATSTVTPTEGLEDAEAFADFAFEEETGFDAADFAVAVEGDEELMELSPADLAVASEESEEVLPHAEHEESWLGQEELLTAKMPEEVAEEASAPSAIDADAMDAELPSAELLYANDFAATDEIASADSVDEESEEAVYFAEDNAFGAEDFLIADEETADAGEPLEGDLLFAAEELYADELSLVGEDAEYLTPEVDESEAAAAEEHLESSELDVDLTEESVAPGPLADESSLATASLADMALSIEDLVFLEAEEVSVEEPLIVADDEGSETELLIAAEDDLEFAEEEAPAEEAQVAEQVDVDAEEDAFEPDESLEVLVAADETADEAPETDLAAPDVTFQQMSHHHEPALDTAHIDEDDFDPDILEIFLEEAAELIEEMDEAIHTWESNWANRDAPDTMKRALHTLKGGARLAGLKNLGELAHEYETFLMVSTDPASNPNYFQILLAYQDQVLNSVRGVRARLDGEPAPAPVPAPRPAPVAPPAAQTPAATAAQVPAVAEVVKAVDDSDDLDDQFMAPAASRGPVAAPTGKRQGSQEMIKVSADLLEELVNLAGETSISRGRLEQQISDLSGAVDEVDGTLRRLHEQLRRLDIETEAQVLFRQEKMASHEQFDPLEMDRYSQLQQLTRSLMESASDLVDLKITLKDKIRDTETLLLQQSRINSALQEGLMRSRMVPFSRLVPRLRRIVRQVSGELGKHVNFELDNVEGEMDRSVLERMVAPLEHMLRNAVDHGIEAPADRIAAGKPETGRILLGLAREGGDILLRLADDGRGINLERVRAKAVERGLMTADSQLSDHEVMQFILQAGFSTAENVTQISGRGVGMDVVAAEIKQLGGAIVIDSKMGVGTQFTVRLPFTVSVNRALMVQLGTETYAIPLNTIEGIVRVSPFELEHYYSHPDARFEYAGENYQVRHLGSMLDRDMQPHLEGQVLPLPVILVRSAQHTMALQVDGLQGSREIVVKSLGPQFAAAQGLSGATVMGDGSVVVILDPHALVRREVALSNLPAPERELPVETVPEPVHKTIMVVDDSVTVRKVMTRFLEREGFNVVTAKDGVDALQLLQEEIPDLMLLDIEMPRMDGFEVAKNVRSTSRLRHLPIIMITSRTGDKHRQHALSIGVNEYLGKPYQEEVLLKTMETLLSKKNKRT